MERKESDSSLSSTKNTRSLKEALSVHSNMERSDGVVSQSTVKSTRGRSFSPVSEFAKQVVEKTDAENETSPRRKSPSLKDALASSRSSMEKLSPKTSLNSLDLLSLKNTSSPAAMMAALERALAASPSQPRAAFQTSADTTLPTSEGGKRDLMQELAKSAKLGRTRHFDDNESEEVAQQSKVQLFGIDKHTQYCYLYSHT